MIFEPNKSMNGFLSEDRAMLRWYVERAISTTKSPLGNTAAADLRAAIYAWTVGLYGEVAPIIPRVIDWLDLAIKGDEIMGESPDFYRMELRWARAIGKWMLHAVNAEEDWSAALTYEEAFWKEMASPAQKRIIQYSLDDYMAFAVQAGRCTHGIEIYESLVGVKKITLSKTLKPRDYAYALCLQQTQGQFNDEDLFEAGRRVLQANLEEEWLGRGQSIRAATWLKIVYWDRDLRAGRTPVLTPLQTILKAYDDMPNVPRPDFLGATTG